MRFVVLGAGAVGGTLAVRLAASDHDVAVVARGAHLAAIQTAGLELRDPGGASLVHVDAVAEPAHVDWREDDVVVLVVKSHDTIDVLRQLADVAPATLPVVCVQNGVTNEPEVLRHFARAYGVVVMCPTVHLRPGVVVAHSHPVPGILDVGRYPGGVDDLAVAVSAAFRSAGFDSHPITDLARWKWAKLLTNLGNAIEAVRGPAARAGELGAMAAAEGEAVLAAAGIDFASADEDRRRRGDTLSLHPVDGEGRPGGSTWQSLQRGTATETDLLNGEIVRLARLHGVPAPVNEVLQRLVRRLTATRSPPGAMTEDQVLVHVSRSSP
ncbi:MAG: ketopantoate reductase family protein [Ilumatobacteraceae bacterium]